MRSRMKAKMRSARCWSCFVTLGPYRTDVHLSIPAREAAAGAPAVPPSRGRTGSAPGTSAPGPPDRILRRVPIDPALVFEYATRTFWALLVIVVTLLLARVVRRTTMRALTRGRAQANVTILLGNLAQVAVFVFGMLLVLAIYTRDAFGWILGSFSVVGIVLGLSLQDILKNFLAGIWVLVERPF